MRLLRPSHVDLLRYAGLITYGCVGVPLVIESIAPPEGFERIDYLGWAASYVIFGLSYWVLTGDLGRRRGSVERWLLLLAMSVAAIFISYFSRSALAGILVLVMSGVLPWILPVRIGILWMLIEAIAMVPVFYARILDYQFGWFTAFLQSALYFGFCCFTFVTSLVAKEQAEAREDQRRLNNELRATRALLADSARMTERIRISRELHDLLGHHLTALSLNLEVASHLASGQAQEHVRQSQSLARLLLSDVREVVSQLRADDEIDLRRALDSLVEGIPEPSIHIEIPERLGVDDPRRAQVLLRCAQEIITNTIRHARARNLWLKFERGPDNALRMSARDDGLGAEHLKKGNGLTGMQERLAQVGGSLRIETATGKGFALEAWIPKENPA
jgi:signal transduction histidine kinase